MLLLVLEALMLLSVLTLKCCLADLWRDKERGKAMK